MRSIIVLALILCSSGAMASDPVTVKVDSVKRKLRTFITAVVRVDNLTDQTFSTIWIDCQAFQGGKAVGMQPGSVTNLRPRGARFTEVSIEAPQADAMACEFNRVGNF